jgi:hypothetical protein
VRHNNVIFPLRVRARLTHRELLEAIVDPGLSVLLPGAVS